MKLIKLKKQKNYQTEKIQFLKQIIIYIVFNNLKQFKYLAKNIFNGKTTLNGAEKDQSNLLVETKNFKKKARSRNLKKQEQKKILLKAYIHFLTEEDGS